MYREIEKPKPSQLTRGLIKEFFEMEPVPGDRAILVKRIKLYELLVSKGLFHSPIWAKCFCKETRATYRVNGKHTSHLFSSLDRLPDLYVTVKSFEADTLEDVVKLYGQFDTRLEIKSAGDLNRSVAQAIPELATINHRIINIVVSGIAFAQHEEQYITLPASQRAEQLVEHVDFVVWVASIVPTRAASPGLARSPVVAAMFHTYAKAKDESTQFWTAVRDETGAKPGMPDRVLARYLLQSNVNYGQGAQASAKFRYTAREMMVKCLHAWNAWRKGEYRKENQRGFAYYSDSPTPRAI